MLQKITDFCKQKNINLLACETADEQRIIKKQEYYPIYSATKTLMALAAGKLIDEKKLGFETTLWDIFPEKIQPEYKTAAQSVTLEKLMSMQIKNIPFRPEKSSLEFCLDTVLKGLKENPGFGFNYSNISAYLAGQMLERVTNQNGFEYLKKNILEPAGIESPTARYDIHGGWDASSGLEFKCGYLIRIAQLIKDSGKGIVSEEFINSMKTIHSRPTPQNGYGLCLWIPKEGVYKISGKWGQRVFFSNSREYIISIFCDEKNPEKLRRLDKFILDNFFSQSIILYFI